MLPDLSALPSSETGFALCDFPDGGERLQSVGGDDLQPSGKFQIKETIADGSCLFHALLQLAEEPTIPGTPVRTSAQTARELRHDVLDWMVDHTGLASKLMDEGVEVKAYTNSMRKDGWGGSKEIDAFVMMTRSIVYVVGLYDKTRRSKVESRRFAHVISRSWPCATNGGAMSAEEMRQLPVLVLVWHHPGGGAAHYSSVHNRSRLLSKCPLSKHTNPRSTKPSPQIPKPNALLGDLRREREARAFGQRAQKSVCGKECELDEATGDIIRRMVLEERQAASDRLLALSLAD